VRRMAARLRPKSGVGKGSLMLRSGRTEAKVHRGRQWHSQTWTRGAMRVEGERGLARWLEAKAEGDKGLSAWLQNGGGPV
jgi:hypothetical protein